MKRLVVLIGVRRPGGGLEELESIEKCLGDMRDWALRQNIPRGDIKIFTDIPELIEPGDRPPLSINDIFSWIDARAKKPEPADQLLIYFSGHGTLHGGAQLWLLPQAPGKTWEAVDLGVSSIHAAWGRFKHVVFIGDCCAVVLGDAQFSFVEGTTILENPRARIRKQTVDVLLAARPGEASLELAINGVSVSPYTVQLLQALGGTPTTILEPQTPGVAAPLVLRVRNLAKELQTSVNRFLRAHNVVPPGSPVDDVVSITEWIALFPSLPLSPQPPIELPPSPSRGPVPPGPIDFVLGADARSRSSALAPPTVGDQGGRTENALTLNLDQGLRKIANGSLVEVPGVNWSSLIPDGYHYETKCGFFISGSSVRTAESRPDVECTVINEREIRIDPKNVELVVIEFKGREGIMIPAIPGQIGFIHVENGRVASVAYEASGHADIAHKSAFSPTFEAKSQRIRNLRNLLLNVVTGGDLSFTKVNPRTLARVITAIPYGQKIDFATLLYLGYVAYASDFPNAAISAVARAMQNQFGFVPLDLKILLSLAQTEPDEDFQFAPPFPLLTLGWSFLKATHEQLQEEFAQLTGHHRNTPWTHLDSFGVGLCQAYLVRQTTSGTSGQGGNVVVAVAEAPVEMKVEDPTAWAG